MSRAEKYIQDYTRNCFNYDSYAQTPEPWLTPDQARKAVEIAREDMMLIHRCIKDAMNYHLYKMMEGVEGQKVVYQEVLKRFKERKEK